MKKLFYLFILIVIFIFSTNSNATGDVDIEIKDEEIKNKLEEISDEEKVILEDLFLKQQEITALKVEELNLTVSIEELERNIVDIEQSLKMAEEDYDKKLTNLSKIFVHYQKNGSVSFFKMIFSAESLSDMLAKMNVFREFSKNTENLLNQIEEEKKSIEEKKLELENTLAAVVAKKDELIEVIAKTEEAIKKNEEALAALRGDRALYEERLKLIEETLENFDKTLGVFTQEFNNLILNGYFPDSVIEQDISLRGIRGIIKEKPFNAMIEKQDIPQIKIRFKKDKIEIFSEEYKLEMTGYFEVLDGTKLKFAGESGTFLGMKLEKTTIDNMISKGYLILDFKPLLGKNTMKKVELRDGFLDIYFNLKLF